MKVPFIDLGAAYLELKSEIDAAVHRVLESGWYISGEEVDAFESSYSSYCGAQFCVGVANGLDALFLSLKAMDIGPGDEVIVPTLTYIASANSITYTGATPVFVDSLENTWQMDPDDVERKITARTKAIMPVHLYGHSCNMDRLRKIAKKHNIFMIEDCAEALGSKYNNKHVGTFGDMSAFSFFGNKTITTGEGGMLVTNDNEIAQRVKLMRLHGIDRDVWDRFTSSKPTWEYDVIAPGYKYNMPDINAAIGLAQLEYLDLILANKRDIAHLYHDLFRSENIDFIVEPENCRANYSLNAVLLQDRRHKVHHYPKHLLGPFQLQH